MEVDVAGFERNAAGRYASDEAADGRNPYNLRRPRTPGFLGAAVARARPADLDDRSSARGGDSRSVRAAVAALGWRRARERDFGTNVVGPTFSWHCGSAGHDRGHRHL